MPAPALADAPPGPLVGEALHTLLETETETEAVLALAQESATVDRSHRKLSHRGNRLGAVFVSTMLRVLTAAGEHLPGLPRVTGKRSKTPWPDWVELIPGRRVVATTV